MTVERDFLDELIEDSTAVDPMFSVLLAAAERRRALVRELVAKRRERGITQVAVAQAMATSQSAVARFEGLDDAKESVIDRYAAAIGVRVQRTVVDPAP